MAEAKNNDLRALPLMSIRLREATASRDLDRIAEVLEARARVLAEHAASASPAELSAAQAENAELAEFLSGERMRIFEGVRQSQRLQRALSQNLPFPDPRLRGTLA